jgi:hypothetical protein
MKNASTHNFFICYPISMNKKIRDMVFQALQNSHKMVFLALSSIANDSQLFFFNFALGRNRTRDPRVPEPKRTPLGYTGCLMKNASTHNFFIYYPISMNKKTKDMVFHALRSSHKKNFWRYFQ